MLSRKEFIKKSSLLLGAWGLFSSFRFNKSEMEEFIKQKSSFSPENLVSKDAYWSNLRKQFTLTSNFLNFNHGAVNPQSLKVQRAHIQNYKYSNMGPAYFMWEKLDASREQLRENLAKKLNCSASEVAINRNTTEGLNNIIFGYPLKAGDEVVLSKYDYPNMINALKQRAERDKIKLSWVDFKFPLESKSEIVATYEKAISGKTKLVLIPHIINWTGQILPVKEIVKMAKDKGCKTIIDGAHSFAHIHVDLQEIDCDFYATSLHKWLGAPFGNGLLYVKKEHIGDVWPLLGSYETLKNDIKKFETIGTRSFAAEMAVQNALDFHELIGAKYIEARFHYLKKYIIKKLQTLEKVKLYTSKNPLFSAGLVSFNFADINGYELQKDLFENHKILTSAVVHEKLNGIRISPHFFNTKKEIDLLIKALQTIH